MDRDELNALADRGETDQVPVCSDLDDDCDDIADKVKCWLYDPAKGRCPFLRAPAALRAQAREIE